MVKYYGKKSSFVGQILSAENNLFAVKYLYVKVDTEQIIQILDEPMLDSREHT